MQEKVKRVGRMSGNTEAITGSAVEDTDDTRLYCRPSAQIWLGSCRNWSVFLERP